MIVEITTSGGFGGLAAAGVNKSASTETMDEPAKARICAAFDPKNLEKLARLESHKGAADQMTYRIIITDDQKKRHEFNLNEGVIPAEMLDMIDEM